MIAEVTTDAFVKYKHQGVTSETKISSNGKTIHKRIIRFLDHDCYERELHVLGLLALHQFDWCPRVISRNDENKSFVMNYCGEILPKAKRPTDYKKQVQKILDDMKSIRLKHNDIKHKETLILNGKVYLIDFGWASIDDDFSCGIAISSRKKPCGIYDDARMLNF